ncbi:hypothetical protein B0H13DRAFT_14790 [Mycena leptocephala]|nr:hypothetical protein B0H13DRAFT_14790 [Mycena leptocephala]
MPWLRLSDTQACVLILSLAPDYTQTQQLVLSSKSPLSFNSDLCPSSPLHAFLYGDKRRSCLAIDPSERRIYDSADR